MTKVTYYFGAGASYGALPIVNQIPERIENLINLMRSGNYRLSDKETYRENNLNQYTKNQIQDWLIEDLEWLLDRTANHASIDTFAKKLYITDKINDLKRLKNAFSVFLILEQSLNKTNMRYDSFFASILKESHYPLPNDINIISWNYDYQLEKAYAEYSGNSTLERNQQLLNICNKYAKSNDRFDKDSFSVVKLNGSSNIINTEWRRLNYFNDDILDEFCIDLVEKVLHNYAALRFSNPHMYSGLSFAWESSGSDYHIDIIEQSKIITKNTDILIVIGYSFPYFNREIDRNIISNMKNLKKVYFQAPDADVLKERFLSIRDDIPQTNLLSRYDVGQFLLPNEL